MNFTEARNYTLNRLIKELPANLFYHDLNHTLDVCKAIDELCEEENIRGEDLILLKTAGIMHDIGFIEQYFNNEPVAVRIAMEVLPSFDYSDEQIRIISNLILATRVPQKPNNLLEMVICDADLDYLGRSDFFIISDSLKREWMANGIVSSADEFNRKQVDFFHQHHYFTRSAREKRNAQKQEHLKEIRKVLVTWNSD